MERLAGRIPVLEALRAKKRKAHRLFLLRGAQGLERIHAMGTAAGVPIEECSRHELDRLAGFLTHQGVVLEAEPLPVHPADGWIKAASFPESAIVVALDGVEDPHNFGAIIRSAVAAGACAVLFGKDRAAPISTASVKSAAGAMEYSDLVQAANLVRSIQALKKAGFWVVGLDSTAETRLWEADLTSRIVLVVGSEGKGMRRLVRKNCDLLVRIPLPGRITTLNASVSAAIALAECLRQRQSGNHS